MGRKIMGNDNRNYYYDETIKIASILQELLADVIASTFAKNKDEYTSFLFAEMKKDLSEIEFKELKKEIDDSKEKDKYIKLCEKASIPNHINALKSNKVLLEFFCDENALVKDSIERIFNRIIKWKQYGIGEDSIYEYKNINLDIFKREILEPVWQMHDMLARKNEKKCSKLKNELKNIEEELNKVSLEKTSSEDEYQEDAIKGWRKLFKIIIASACLLLICVAIFFIYLFNNNSKSIDVSKYVKINTIHGSSGAAKIDSVGGQYVDLSGLIEKITQIANDNNKKEMADEDLFKEQLETTLLKPEINKTNNIKNGDEIFVKINWDEETLKKVGFDLKNIVITKKISGLKEMKTINPFKDLRIVNSGALDREFGREVADIRLENSRYPQLLSSRDYVIKEGKDVAINAHNDEANVPTSYEVLNQNIVQVSIPKESEKRINEKGYRLTKRSEKLLVDIKPLMSKKQINSESIKTLKNSWDNVVENWSEYNSEEDKNTSVTNKKYIGYIFLKANAYPKDLNRMVGIYKVDYEIGDGIDKESDSGYLAVPFNGVLIDNQNNLTIPTENEKDDDYLIEYERKGNMKNFMKELMRLYGNDYAFEDEKIQ